MKQFFSSHRHSIRRITAFVLMLVMIMVPLSFGESNKVAALVTDADVRALQQKIDNNEQQIKAYEQKITSLKNNITSTIELKAQIDGQIAVMQTNIEDTNLLIERYEELIRIKNAEIESRVGDYDVKYNNFLEMMRIYYEDNTTNYLDMVLGADSFTDFLTQFERIGSLLTMQDTLMKELNQETVDLSAMKADLQQKQVEAEQLRVQQQEAQKELENKLSETDALIAKLEQDEQIAKASLAQRQALDQQFDRDMAELLRKIEEQKKSQYVGGMLAWPLDGSFNYVSSKYGWRTIWGKADWHTGVDIIKLGYNIYGQPIMAANDGEVLVATSHWSYGNYVLIDHGGGYATLYAHCSQLLVTAGQHVTKGQVIAKIGSTGQSTGNHLHFEVRVNGDTVDPIGSGLVSYPRNLVIAQ